MWYQRESKLKMPRLSASLAVRAQWATTAATTAMAIRALSSSPRVLSGVWGGPAGGEVLDPPKLPPPPDERRRSPPSSRVHQAAAPATAKELTARSQA